MTSQNEDVRSVLTELLRLYDWRNEIGRIERDFNHDKKQVKTWLNQYGREKKAAWEAAVRVLSASSSTRPRAPGLTEKGVEHMRAEFMRAFANDDVMAAKCDELCTMALSALSTPSATRQSIVNQIVRDLDAEGKASSLIGFPASGTIREWLTAWAATDDGVEKP